MLPPAPTRSTRDHPTRKQLDELDALLQRMLALPVQPEDEPESDSEEQADENVRETECDAADAPNDGTPTSEREALAPVRLESLTYQGVPAPVRLESPTYQAPNVEKEAAEEAQIHIPPATDDVETAEPLAKPATTSIAAESRPEETKIFPSDGILPWINYLFDQYTGYLGVPGRWLRRPVGRALLGWTGMLLLATSVAIVILDWIGWTW